MSHEAKRIQLSEPEYYAPRLPQGARLLSIDSARVAGDIHFSSSAATVAASSSSSSGFPELPDDIRSKLVHVGMKTRKVMAESHRLPNSNIPSYQPNYFTSSFTANNNRNTNNDVVNIPTAFQPTSARKYFSENDKFSLNNFNDTPLNYKKPALSRRSLKRNRQDSNDFSNADSNRSLNKASGPTSFIDKLDEENDTDDDDGDNTLVNNTRNDSSTRRSLLVSNPSGVATATLSTGSSIYEPNSKALRQSSNQSGTIPAAKIFYVPANRVTSSSSLSNNNNVNDSNTDFEEASFLDNSNI